MGAVVNRNIDVDLSAMHLPAFPLLRCALRNQKPAHSTKIEWIVDRPEGEVETLENYCQIVRTPFEPEQGDELELGLWLYEHLKAIENVLWFGEPARAGWTKTCGGVLYFLGRDPLPGDHIAFRPFRETRLLLNRGVDGDPLHEFLTEFSLQVTPSLTIAKRPS